MTSKSIRHKGAHTVKCTLKGLPPVHHGEYIREALEDLFEVISWKWRSVFSANYARHART